MNIGIVIPGFSDGEQDWCIPVYLNLVRSLAESDDISVFALRYPARRDHYRVYGAQVHAIGGHSGLAGFSRWVLLEQTIATIIQQHRRKPFDLLHAIWADETGFVACVAGKLIGVPVVVSLAGGELADLPDYGLQSGRVTRWLVRQALTRADCVIAPCDFSAALARRTRWPIQRLETVPLGVDVDRFIPGGQNGTRLLAVGSLTAVKGHSFLLHALSLLPGRGLDIVGDGPLLSSLRSLAESLGIADRVMFHGAVPHDALPGWYQNAALHVLPSRYEAFGMVVIEAAACGLPTVGFQVGVLTEIDQPAGFAVPTADVAQFAAAIDDLMANPGRLRSAREAARHIAVTHYSLEAMCDGLRSIYKVVAEKT